MSRPSTTLLTLAIMIATAGSLGAQPVDSVRAAPAIGDTILSDLVAVGTDALMLVGAPARFELRDWAVAAGSAAAVGLLVPFDDDLRDAARRSQGSDGDDISEVANVYGTFTPAIVVSGGLYLGGLAFDEPGVRLAGRHVGQAVLYAGLITTAAKFIVGRERPMDAADQLTFDAFSRDDRFYSFPSGHATLAFALSSSLAADIDHPVATVILYALASTTALSRVYTDRHWASDALLGAAIGTACGYGVANLGALDERESSLHLIPGPDRLTLVWSFR